MLSHRIKLKQITHIFIPLLVFASAAFIYSLYGFHGWLARDDAIYLYSGQRLAQGVPPYVSTFDVKGPLASLLTGLGVIISNQLGWDDIITVRLVFFLLSCSTVVATYLLGKSLFQSQRIGVFGALAFLGFWGFARHAASGPRAKTPMVLFGTLSLWLTSRRDWFRAGLSGMLAFLTWQPAAILPLVTLVFAAVQPRGERLAALFRTLAGIGLPAAVVGAYFYRHNALYALLDGILLFHIRYADRGEFSVLSHVKQPIKAIFFGYGTMLLPIIIGFIMIVYLYIWRSAFCQTFRNTLFRDRFAPVLLSFPAFLVWSFVDFQWYADFYPFLPYIAIGFGKFLDLAVEHTGGSSGTRLWQMISQFLAVGLCAALIALAGISVRLSRESELHIQKQTAVEIEHRYGRDVKLVSIGAPQLLVLLHQVNPTPYDVIIMGIDRRIHANTPDGFGGWLHELEAYNPDIIGFGQAEGLHIHKLMNWLESRYQEERVGPWRLYVRDSLNK